MNTSTEEPAEDTPGDENEDPPQNTGDENQDPAPEVRSTKRPLAPKSSNISSSKKRKDERDAVELDLLKVMTKAIANPPPPTPVPCPAKPAEDDDQRFADYIATELRRIRDPQSKAALKMSIQNQIYSAQFDVPYNQSYAQPTYATPPAAYSQSAYSAPSAYVNPTATYTLQKL